MKKIHIFLNTFLAAIVVAMAALCFYPTDDGVSVLEEEVFFHGDESSNGVSLMFNVYEGTEVVYSILDTLDKFSAKCTFFLGGCWADDNVNCVKEILSRGHELGNHGYFHKDHDKLNAAGNRQEIQTCHDFILKATGYEMNLFAPPSGAYNDTTVKTAKSLGYKTIMWTKDTIDWRDKDPNVIYSRAIDVKGGAFVLMHPKEQTLNALESILENYSSRSLSCVTVSDNLKSLII